MPELPVELLHQVFFHLRQGGEPPSYDEAKRNLDALSNISLASKAFHGIARRAMYHTLNFRTIGLDCLPLLLRTFHERPASCHLVAHLHVPEWDQIHDPHADPNAPDAEVLQMTDRLHLPPELRQRLRDGLARGLEDAMLALLLCMCTRLRVLALEAAHRIQGLLVGAVFQASAQMHRQEPSSHPYALLAEVDFRHWQAAGPTRLSDLSAFLQLPALEVFRGWMLDCTSSSDLSHIQSTAQDFYLEDSPLDTPGMEQLFRACPAMKRFSKRGTFRIAEDGVAYGGLGEVLRRHGANLVHLTFNPETNHIVDRPDWSPLGQLRQLESLKILSVPPAALFGSQEHSDDDHHDDDDDDDDHDNNDDGEDSNESGYWNSERYLVETLPRSLKSLRISGPYRAEEVEVRDAQLLELMEDASFHALTSIRIHREEPFSYDLDGLSWSVSISNKFWQVLKKTPPAVETGW